MIVSIELQCDGIVSSLSTTETIQYIHRTMLNYIFQTCNLESMFERGESDENGEKLREVGHRHADGSRRKAENWTGLHDGRVWNCSWWMIASLRWHTRSVRIEHRRSFAEITFWWTEFYYWESSWRFNTESNMCFFYSFSALLTFTIFNISPIYTTYTYTINKVLLKYCSNIFKVLEG